MTKLWKAKFFALCDVILLVILQEKFEIEHSWKLRRVTATTKTRELLASCLQSRRFTSKLNQQGISGQFGSLGRSTVLLFSGREITFK